MFIYKRVGSRTRIRHNVLNEPETSKAYSSYILLRHHLRIQDIDYKRQMAYNEIIAIKGNAKQAAKRKKYKDRIRSITPQAVFNMEFLRGLEAKHASLHCVYCGKQNLRIFDFHEHPNKEIMATCDHILPRADYPELAMEESNCTSACLKCNREKNRKLQPILYPYGENIQKTEDAQ